MYVIAISHCIEEGAYAVVNDDGERALYFFKDEDDAHRYAGLLEADDFPKMEVIEVEDRTAIETCEKNNYHYVIVKPNDFVIPPYNNVEYSKDSL